MSQSDKQAGVRTGEDEELDFSFVLASSVHDMKNSLGMLLHTLGEVIEQSPPQDEAQARQFAVLQYETSRINSELVQLLALYRMQERRMLVDVDEQYVRDVIEDQIARNDMLFQTRGINVELDCDDDLAWYFDAELIGGVINNVLVNAARYTRETLKVSARVDEHGLLISIADDGTGYPQAMLDAPAQENAGVSFSSGNTHLGLLFAQRVVEAHKSKGARGALLLENGGELGGGILNLRLP
ncbi:sensor histidine kinase [Marinimicrobium alkaliphilum]|uniref:sensor histidine kinase n=1 Tax=Marinimicrobium alkaliphilum TaxID=2202654 RepID=UPI000DBA2DE9|nr:HAMP domain-containing sensor histidine kinase [Marinimicrobium alkaliphilum]